MVSLKRGYISILNEGLPPFHGGFAMVSLKLAGPWLYT